MDSHPQEDFVKFAPNESYFYEGSGYGPEGVRDYRPHLVNDPRAVGIGSVSNEQSLDSAYVLRPAPGATLDRPRSCRPGEIGWGVPWLVDWSLANSGQQIMLGDFRQIAEDRVTHEGIGAWYPHPEQETPPGQEGYYKENIFSGRPETDADLPTFSAEQQDPTQGVCPEPVDRRPPFRAFYSSQRKDSSMLPGERGSMVAPCSDPGGIGPPVLSCGGPCVGDGTGALSD